MENCWLLVAIFMSITVNNITGIFWGCIGTSVNLTVTLFVSIWSVFSPTGVLLLNFISLFCYFSHFPAAFHSLLLSLLLETWIFIYWPHIVIIATLALSLSFLICVMGLKIAALLPLQSSLTHWEDEWSSKPPWVLQTPACPLFH